MQAYFLATLTPEVVNDQVSPKVLKKPPVGGLENP